MALACTAETMPAFTVFESTSLSTRQFTSYITSAVQTSRLSTPGVV